MAANHLNRRLDLLEDQALAEAERQEAERIGALIGCDPAVLLERAQVLGTLVERHGVERVLEIVGEGLGISAEALETRVARLSPGA